VQAKRGTFSTPSRDDLEQKRHPLVGLELAHDPHRDAVPERSPVFVLARVRRVYVRLEFIDSRSSRAGA
jgi:hypothetical protein